jgi:general nucleoside transport system permease protein
MDLLVAALGPGLRTASPILLAALGGIFSQRAGIFNIALEGYMLLGAFVSVLVTSVTGSIPLALAAAVLASMLLALAMGVFVIALRGDEIIVGIAVNLLAVGLTAFFLQELTSGASFLRVDLSLPNVDLPFLEPVPVIGPLLAHQSVLVWLSFLLIPLVSWTLFRSGLGLRMRAVGENRDAAISAGVAPDRLRFIAFAITGAFCGLAGAELALGVVSLFSINMTAGRGIIAFAAVTFGAAVPRWVVLAALLFGFADAVANRMQTLGLPVQFVLMVPYLLTIVVLLTVAVPWSRLLRRDQRGSA